MLREKPRHIGARAEEGGMAERDDARIAEDEIEREREERQYGDLVDQEAAARPDEKYEESPDPKHDLGEAP